MFVLIIMIFNRFGIYYVTDVEKDDFAIIMFVYSLRTKEKLLFSSLKADNRGTQIRV